MIKSAAIVKTKTLAPWKELRLQKRKLKKAQAAERKLVKQYFPSPINAQAQQDVPIAETVPPTRAEMEEQAAKIGIKADKRWSDATLLKRINEAMEATWDTANANS
jgi:hypothetical protein